MLYRGRVGGGQVVGRGSEGGADFVDIFTGERENYTETYRLTFDFLESSLWVTLGSYRGWQRAKRGHRELGGKVMNLDSGYSE